MKHENTTAQSTAQPRKPHLSDLRSRFRAAYGVHGISRILLEDQAESCELLSGRDREALLSALEHCAETLYAYHEHAYQDALPHAAEQGGAQ
ncbi:hypothetical protein AA098_07180 [Pseudomonas sp. JY-Q]|uniref:hypothetical protein n=1 Tax=Pseudomonas sp. JY-Q TaxID=1338689 RepID=UPI0007DDF5CB|nr:hypothetical protein [Pseudomonas sp. JY-Q]ANI33285.1 hypothetical protein AA098_07180 [Pseudomonas sp. JY-Q]